MIPKVLVTNDDSVHSKGLLELVIRLKKYAKEIMIVAPTREKSAVSHSITIRRGLKLHQLPDLVEGVPTYSVEGTPADCVKVAKIALGFDFDVAFSGVNDGLNMADDVMYSGTVAGAAEAVMFGKVGIAVSVKRNGLEALENGFDMVMDYFQKNNLLEGNLFFNVNIPENALGIQLAHQTKIATETKFKLQEGLHYMIGDPDRKTKLEDQLGDVATYFKGYISVTPLTNNRTDYQVLSSLTQKNK
jgi:5'-nucleotidase